jgi:YD repeat-containing protein
MAIDPQSGLIVWTPTAAQAGPQQVTVVVRDTNNAIATQSFIVSAKANQPPTITSTAPTAPVSPSATYRYDVRATDPDNDPLTYVLTSGPTGMTIDNAGRIRWSVPVNFDPSQAVSAAVAVSDPFGHTVTQSFGVTVQPDTTKPTVRLTTSATLVDSAGRFVVDLNGQVRFQVQASDNVGVAKLTLMLGGVPVSLDASGVGFATLTTPGIVHVVATAFDAAGNQSTAELDLRVRDPNDADAPQVEITSPDQARTDNIVTYLTNVIGSVHDDNLLSWHLDYALASAVDLNDLTAPDSDWVQISAGTTNVDNGLLGVFDPTMLPNDGYVLRLYAEDTGGLINTRGVLVGVQGAAKLGNFHLDFTDLTVPLAGFPINITRSYDTLQANEEGDFGFGWKLGLTDADIRETVPDGFSFQLGTRVYLTDPSGQRVGFTFDPIQQGTFLGTLWTPSFTADPGVHETLTVDDTQVGAPGTIYASLSGPFNPHLYHLTTPDGTRYDYDQTAGLQKVTDLNGNTITFTADAIVHSAGERIDLHRDGRGRITEIVDTQGHSLKYAYNAAGDLVSFTDQVNNTTTFTYVAGHPHYLDEIHDPLGRRVSKTIYGPDGRIQKVIDVLGDETLENFDPTHFTGTITDAEGNVTLLEYDARGNVVRKEDPEGGVTLSEYTDAANPDKETKVTRLGDNGKQIVTSYTYDSRGNTTTITDSFGTTSYQYDALGDVTKVVDALGHVTTAAYNSQGKLTSLVNAAGDTSSRTYDTLGRVATSSDFDGNTTTLLYNPGCPCGIPSDVVNPDGTTRHFEHNDFGQITLAEDEEGITTQTLFDASGRVTVEQGPQGQETRYFYVGQLLDHKEVQVSATEVRTTTYTYYDDGKLRTETDANGGVIRYTYDKNGNLETLTDPENNVTTFHYDKMNRETEEIDPLGKATTYHYDKFGNRDQEIDRMGRKRTFDYDDTGRMLHEYWWTGASIIRTISYTYDALGNLLTATDPDSSLTYTYDVLNRVHTADNAGTPGVPRVILTSTYDANGNRISVGDNLGVTVVSTYDDRNRLDTRGWEGLSATDAALVNFDYYGNGLLKDLTRYSDLTETTKVGQSKYTYDASGRSDTITHLNAIDQVLASYSYQYDRANQLTHQVYDGPEGDFAADYKYDSTGQLTNVDYLHDEFPDELYHYDKNGNRTSARVDGQSLVYERIAGNRYTSDGQFDYTYDGEGNLTTRTEKATSDVTSYEYDFRNRLTHVIVSDKSQTVIQDTYQQRPQAKAKPTASGRTCLRLISWS